MQTEGSQESLPTLEECRAFLDAINAERATGGLEPLQVLDFDRADPDSLSNCLSARNCYMPLGYEVDTQMVYEPHTGTDQHPIPAEILRVTDVFDAADSDRLSALRARLVEAGVVES